MKKPRPPLASEHLRWRLRERRTTEALLELAVQSLPAEEREAARKRIQASKPYPA